MKPKIIVIVGPTASGKTALSLAIAERFNGEIISCDSRQFYRGMDIGTDKVTEDQRRGIPHHFIDIVDPDELYTLNDFKRDADAKILEIVSRGKLPILVGGTGLYISAVIENYSLSTVPRNEAWRTEMSGKSVQELAGQLTAADPDTAVDLNNKPRIIRALEVLQQGTEGVSPKTAEPLYDVLLIQPAYDRQTLYTRINERVAEHVRKGLIEEVRRISGLFGWDIYPMTGIGYRQYRPCIEGKEPLVACIEQHKKDSRNYAKRQVTWFKRYDDRMVVVTSITDAEPIIREFLTK